MVLLYSGLSLIDKKENISLQKSEGDSQVWAGIGYAYENTRYLAGREALDDKQADCVNRMVSLSYVIL